LKISTKIIQRTQFCEEKKKGKKSNVFKYSEINIFFNENFKFN
jgi:hypothetical protein